MFYYILIQSSIPSSIISGFVIILNTWTTKYKPFLCNMGYHPHTNQTYKVDFVIFFIRYSPIFFLLQVNSLDALGQTVLHRCAREGNVQACRILLSYDVDTSIISLQGYTAAQVANESVQKLLSGRLFI